MELRKCECGGDEVEIYEVITEDWNPYGWKATCYICIKETRLLQTEQGAIQAWNEGKVE